MKDKDFNPHVRYVEKVTSHRAYPEMICAYDYRMFYVTIGAFCVKLQKEELRLTAGDLLTIPPGTPYRLVFDKKITVEYYILNFDFDSRSSHKPARAPAPEKNFDKDDIFSMEFTEPFGEIFVLNNADMVEPMLEQINDYDSDVTWHNKCLQSALMKYLLTNVSAAHMHRGINPETEAIIQDVKNYINKNYSDGITNQTVAKQFAYHPYYLNSLFLKSEKITLHKYIENVRLKKAKEMLVMTDRTVYEIAYDCGFTDASYFCKFFARNVGITPKGYRNLSK